MHCHIAVTVMLGAISVASIICTVKSITSLYQQHAIRFTYLIGVKNVMFQAYTNAIGGVVYDVFLDGVLMRTTKSRQNVCLASSSEDAFRMRLAHTLVTHRNKHVSFSPIKIVQNTILDTAGAYVSHGSPYLVCLEDSVLRT
jgi:hypothetical protein